MEKQASALDRAIAALRAVEVAPGKYAFFNNNHWYSVTIRGLMRRAEIEEQFGHKVNPFGIWMHEVARKEVLVLPSWWSPERQYAALNAAGHVIATGSSKSAATLTRKIGPGFLDCEIDPELRIVTVSLDSGQEVEV